MDVSGSMYRFNGYDGRLKQEANLVLANPSPSPNPNPKPDQVRHSVRAKAYDHGAAVYRMLQRKAALAKQRPAVPTAAP